MKIQLEIELTEEQVEFIKSLEAQSVDTPISINDVDLYHELMNMGILSEYTDPYGCDTERTLTEIGLKIKQQLDGKR